MPGRVRLLAISTLAVVGLILQGPLLCALQCLVMQQDHPPGEVLVRWDRGPRAVALAGPQILEQASLDAPELSETADLETAVLAHCQRPAHGSSRSATMTAPGPSTDEARFWQSDLLPPSLVAARLVAPRHRPSAEPTDLPLEHPPTYPS